MILFLALTACALALLAVVLWQGHQQRARIENWRAIEAERTARENTSPLSSVRRVTGRGDAA